MTVIERSTVVGVFTNSVLAERAIDELHHVGFTNEQIGFVARGTAAQPTSTRDEETKAHALGATTGAVGGGVAGGLLSAAAALLIPGFGPALAGGMLVATLGGAVLGAITGGFVGALKGMGVSEEEAHYYQRELETGRTLVTVNAGERNREVIEILRRNGAYDASTEPKSVTTEASSATTSNDPNNAVDTNVQAGEYNPNIPPGASL